MHHQYLLYLFLLSSLSLNAMHDQKNSNEITIHEAVYRGDIEAVRKLLDSGIDVDEKAKETKRSTISGRIRYNFRDFGEITKWKKGDSPLLIAMNHQRKSIVQLLLERNASVNVKDCYGWTDFQYAIRSARPEYVKVFLACGADTSQRYTDNSTPLHIAVYKAFSYPPSYSSIDYSSIVKTLLKYNAQVTIENNRGKTPLDTLLKIKGIRELYLPDEKSQKKTKKIKKVRRIRIRKNGKSKKTTSNAK